MLKSDFFSTENFNIFYNLEPSRFSKSPLRARTWPEKNPPKQIKIFISEINFSISEVENLDFQLKKKREPSMYGFSPLRYTKIQHFSAKSKLH